MKNQNECQVTSYIDSAQEHLRNNDITLAFEVLWELAEVEPENLKVINLIARCYYIWGDFGKAESYWEKVLRQDAADQEALSSLSAMQSPAFQFWLKRYYQAINIIENKNYEEGRFLLWQILKENDGFVGLYQLLGLSYLASSDKTTARRIWSRGLEIDKSNKLLLNYMDLVINDLDETLFEVNKPNVIKTSKIIPHSRMTWALSGFVCLALFTLSGVYINSHQDNNKNPGYTKAPVKAASTQTESRTEDIPVFSPSTAAAVAQNNGHVDDTTVQGGADYDYEHEKDYYDKGYNAYLNGSYKTACSNLEAVVSMNTQSYRNREALYYLARINYLSSNYGNAERFFDKYTREFPDSNYYDESLFYLGCIYQATGKTDLARAAFKRLQETVPESGYLSAKVVTNIMSVQ
ncbi:MAG: tetratricopeptide repeat protein [Syntrophomonas sp.]